MNLYENRSENSSKGDTSNDTAVNPPLFSLVNTFKEVFIPGLADLAGELLDLAVDGELVLLQAVRGLEAELALLAGVGALPSVVHHVPL